MTTTMDTPHAMHPLDVDEPLLHEEPGRSRFVMHPVRHEKLYDMAMKAQAAFWTIGEIDLEEDLPQWRALTPEERHYLEVVLAFFAASDGIVNENLVERFMREVKCPEARFFYGIQIGVESIHAVMYSILISTYVEEEERRDQLFRAIETMPCVRAKAEWAIDHIESNDAPFAERLLAFAIVEGVFFSSSFAAIYYFKSRGVLPGLAQSNEYISRDEGHHTNFAVALYVDHIHNRLSEAKVHEMLTEAVNIECEFVDASLPDRLIGMNADLMCQYVRFVANRLAQQLGYRKVWGPDDDAPAANPFDFMDNISTETKTNFFERRPTDYKRSDTRRHEQSKGSQGFGIDADF